MEQQAESIEALKSISREFIAGLSKGNTAQTIALYGELGAGKTAFVKTVAEVLGIAKTVTSPTFVIEKIYKIPNNIFSYLIHIDAYRLENEEELSALGFKEQLENSDNLIFVEWAERVKTLLPRNTIHIKFETINETTRKLTFSHDS